MTTNIVNNTNANEGAGLDHLVEAATALTQLVKTTVPISTPKNTTTVSDDDSTVNIRGVVRYSNPVVTVENSRCPSPTSPVRAGGFVMNSSSPPTTTSQEPGKEIFPQRLMNILSDQSISHIITWLPNGNSFFILRPNELADKILPKHFPESCSASKDASAKPNKTGAKYPSFTRKLNRWGFRQVPRGPDAGAFHHKFFRRDEPDLCLRMECQRSRRIPTKKEASKKGVQKNEISSPANIISATTTTTQTMNPLDSSGLVLIAPVTDTESISSTFGGVGATIPLKKRTLADATKRCTQILPTPNPISPPPPQLSSGYLSSPLATTTSTTNATVTPGSVATTNLQPTIATPNYTVLPAPTPYLDARALVQHNLAINAALALTQAQQIQQQQQQQQQTTPSIATLMDTNTLASIMQSRQVSTTTTTPSVSIDTIQPQAQPLATTTNNPVITTTSAASPPVAVTQNMAQQRAESAKNMLYNAYLQALG